MKFYYFFCGMATQAALAGAMSAIGAIELNIGQQVMAAAIFASAAIIIKRMH